MSKVELTYYSDLLCVWAYVSQVRLDELQQKFGSQLEVEYRFTNTFASVKDTIETRWGHRGGVEAYAAHVQDLQARWPHVDVDPNVWRANVPASSAHAHIFVKAAQLAVSTSTTDPTCGKFIWQLRKSFFAEGKNISKSGVLRALASEQGLPLADIDQKLASGEATAALFEDLSSARNLHVPGSPAFILNGGRQVLYGNVGYKTLEANVAELCTEHPYPHEWC